MVFWRNILLQLSQKRAEAGKCQYWKTIKCYSTGKGSIFKSEGKHATSTTFEISKYLLHKMPPLHSAIKSPSSSSVTAELVSGWSKLWLTGSPCPHWSTNRHIENIFVIHEIKLSPPPLCVTGFSYHQFGPRSMLGCCEQIKLFVLCFTNPGCK